MRLTCHAPHPHSRRAGQPCNAPLGRLDEPADFVTTAPRMPEHSEGIWLRCSRCGTWNHFTRSTEEQAA